MPTITRRILLKWVYTLIVFITDIKKNTTKSSLQTIIFHEETMFDV
jgi:hypothetical protein